MAAAAALSLVAGCSSSRPAPPATPHAAGEPAVAPEPSVVPAGVVAPVGAAPEGIAVDPLTGVVAVALRDPDRLQLLDPTTLAVRHAVQLPGHARHLQAVRGRVLVPCEDADELVVVDAATGATVSTTHVGRQPHDATETATGDVVVGDEFGRALSVVAGGTLRRTVTGIDQPGGVTPLAGPQVAAVDVLAYTLSVFDVATGARLAITSAGAGPTHVAALDAGTVVVADTRGGALLVYSTSPLRQLVRLPVAGTPYGLAVDPVSRTVWTTLTAVNQVVGYAWDGTALREIARYPTPRQPDTVGLAPGARTVYVTGTAVGGVQRVGR